ncbi:hypothetical protein K505DRAFT_400887 [Melanomma pulvis-pyrius CBS 109.77]|uniref:Uncharacterized protein n=1 Tax=Melanomma pulvis-pyrius CBS 109.77 TaxID=1314802 RepID=A0A6A6XX25_9PLEO|nr:hypothetical protein K505DRAFT_400887 [Melanomma pulvis-pyrius CBS 109.77]
MATSSPISAPTAPLPTDAQTASIPTSTTQPTPAIDPIRLARWGPRWTPSSIATSIHQYTLETGWVEGTVYQWSVTQTDHDDIVFHSALDVMAATLHRTKTILVHCEPLSNLESLAISAEIQNVETTMRDLLYQFTLIRPLETDIMAWNVGVGMEQHYGLFCKFEAAVREKLTGEGLEEAEKAFLVLDKMFTDTIEVFKGPPGSSKPEEMSQVKAE